MATGDKDVVSTDPDQIFKFKTVSSTGLGKWDKRFIALAEHISAWSKDPSTQVGAVISRGNEVVSLGFNGLPKGVEDHPERYENREVKYAMIMHGDMNAILYARGDLHGCTMYTFPQPPCTRCAAALIQVGIKRVVAPPFPEICNRDWIDEFHLTEEMYKDAGVELCLIS